MACSERTWLESDLNTISTQWTDLLMTSGLQASIYNIEGDRLLLSTQKGWFGEDIKEFLLTRGEVNKLTWNGVETLSEHYVEA